jgi:hypothetical protein
MKQTATHPFQSDHTTVADIGAVLIGVGGHCTR